MLLADRGTVPVQLLEQRGAAGSGQERQAQVGGDASRRSHEAEGAREYIPLGRFWRRYSGTLKAQGPKTRMTNCWCSYMPFVAACLDGVECAGRFWGPHGRALFVQAERNRLRGCAKGTRLAKAGSFPTPCTGAS